MDAADAKARSSFGAQLTGYQFADVAIVSGFSSAATFKRTAPLIARSGIDNISLLVYAEGGCALDADGSVTEVSAGDVCFLDLSRLTALRAPNYDSLTLILPRAALQPYIAGLDSLHGRIKQKKNPLNAILVNHLQTLFAEAPTLSATDGRAAAAAAARAGKTIQAIKLYRQSSGVGLKEAKDFIEEFQRSVK
jgi:ribosomal protein L7/L12